MLVRYGRAFLKSIHFLVIQSVEMLEMLLEFYPKEESKRLLVDVSKRKFNFLVAKYLLKKGICNVNHVRQHSRRINDVLSTTLLNAVITEKEKKPLNLSLEHSSFMFEFSLLRRVISELLHPFYQQ